ncbi:MAG: putative bifunctional diguanylate cyclase/phosphodiesterase, partial [Solirubrobacteraceae bacterium]
VGALGIARRDLRAALRDERRRFQPRLRRLNTDAKNAGMHQQHVAQRASRSADRAFVGSLVFGLLALGLIGLHFQRLRRRATIAEERRAIERRSEERLRALVEHSNDVVTVVDRELVVRWQAASIQSMLGHEPASLVGRSLTTIVDPDDADLFERVLLGCVRRSGSVRVSARFRHADGNWRHVETVAENRLHDPVVEGVVLSMRDVTERKALEDELRHQAFHDALTGLANRALFGDRLSQALARARRSNHGVAVLFLDLDDFKTVNDSLGHPHGDELLKAVAVRIQETLRPEDTAARLGGDEFAILVELTRDEDADGVAARILDALSPGFEIAGRDLRVTASIGLAYSAGGHAIEEILRNADTAMYEAKADGKASVRTFEQGMHRRALDKLELTGELRRAIETQDFQLDYQPIVALDEERIVAVEALVRWPHPQRRLMAPERFIGLAEESGMIVPLGLWILETACAQIRGCQLAPGQHEQLTLSVNVSTRQLQEPDFPVAVGEVLRRTGLPPSTLTLEITESLLHGDHDAILVQLEQLKALGVRIAVDDFGMGYSCLAHLGRFPIDMLKIDRFFIGGIEGDDAKTELMRGIVNLGESLRLDVVAEGIERAEQVEELRAMGVRLGQGFLFSPPVTAEALHELLAGRAAGSTSDLVAAGATSVSRTAVRRRRG